MKIRSLLKVNGQKVFLILFICSLFGLAYLFPMIFYSKVAGTDVYTHMLYTEEMASVDSLGGFYDIIPEERVELGYNYPFGLWLFGSLVSKITGMSVYDTAYILPFLFIIITLLVYYFYSKIFLEDENQRIMSIVFLLSIPIVSIFLLRYRSSVIVIPLLLLALYCGLHDRLSLKKRLVLISLSVPLLCLTHTGTYMFLLSFLFTFIVFYAAIWGIFHRKAFLLFASSLITYILVMGLTPNIQEQYITKFTLVLTVGDFISSKLHLSLVKSLSEIFYREVCVNKSLVYVLLWLGFTYAILILLIHVRRGLSKLRISRVNSVPATIPLIGNIQNISHSAIATPIWANPAHSILSLIGFFNINSIGKCAFLAVLVVTVLPGSMVTSATGALREIFYLLVIIPVTATVGFFQISRYIDNNFKGRVKGALSGVFSLLVLSTVMVAPIVGNLYYLPTISGKPSEIEGMIWLSNYGSPAEKAIGVGYRDEISVYAKKEGVYASHGSETRRLGKLIDNIYQSYEGEASLKNLYSEFNPKYIISSDDHIRRLQSKGKYGGGMDENRFIDKIYNSENGFTVYSLLPPSYRIVETSNRTTEQINFDESPVDITDSGATYLIQADNYRIRIGKEKPKITFLGGSTANSLIGAGYFTDSIALRARIDEKKFSKQFDPSNIQYSSVELNNNRLSYKAFIENEGTRVSTFVFRYTFYQKAIKKEVIVANDWLNRGDLQAYLHTRIFSPLTHFSYQYKNQKLIEKIIYPAEDSLRVSDARFDNVFVSNGDYGIYIEYDKTSPYPTNIIYKGSTLYDYGFLDFYLVKNINPASSVHITQYISLGEKETARNNVDYYKSISLYPYPDGELPILITSRMPSFNRDSSILINNILDAYGMFNERNISDYTEAVSLDGYTSTNLSGYSPYIIGYLKTGTNDSIADLLNNSNITGIIPAGFRYDLETVNALYNEGILFAELIPVGYPYYMYNQEGLRHLQLAYYNGTRISLVIFPVSTPDSSYLREGLDTGERISLWARTIDASVEYDDMVNLQWDTSRIGSPRYINEVGNLTQYIISKGMTFTTPERLARHYLLMQNVSLTAFKGIDAITLRIENRNPIPMNDATVRVVLPKINFQCPYIVENAKISRTKEDYRSCIYYVSTALRGGESKVIAIRPDMKRKGFSLFIEDNLIEGEVCLNIRDNEKKPVVDAFVTISGERYKTNINGRFCTYLKKGEYTLKLEKPGYETTTFELTVKSKLYTTERIDPVWLLLVIFSIPSLFLLGKFLSRNRWFRIELKKVGRIEKEIEELEDRIELKK